MPNIAEYFDVNTEGGRLYLVQATNAAHAAFRVEEQYQERVTSVYLMSYDKIILIGETNATKTPSLTEVSNTESTGTALELADTTEDHEEIDPSVSTRPQDVQD